MAGNSSRRLSVAVDIGGTFTDLVAFDEDHARVLQAKSLTTPRELSQGVWDCLRKAGVDPAEAADIVHGSTIAINLAIEHKGAKTALVVTKGTRDVYKIGRQNRPEAYDFFFKRPVPLAARSRTFEVDERLLAGGDVLTPFDAEQAQRVAEAVRASGAEAVAVCFLHSYANPLHEIQMGRLLRDALPGVYVSLSHEIVREYREYERTSTTVMNAYIGPKSSQYIGAIESRLAAQGFAGRFSIMQSNGGVMSPETAKNLPVAMMESGPVGGVIAAAEVGARLGLRDVIAFDMGGTTAKTSLIKDGEVSVAQGYYIGGPASGHPVMFPVVDIIEVGAGGGSIAWIDEVGALKVGPHSAGADPGPIAYRRGGTEPTITDANVVLGRIGTGDFLGGEMDLDAAGAQAGLAQKVGARLELDAADAARAVIAIAIAKMSLAVREVSVAKGYDPRDFALVASGGAGPPHALAIARELHIPTVIVPVFPSHFSALGMLMADERHDFSRTCYAELQVADFAALGGIVGEMQEAARRLMKGGGAATHQIFFDLRYVGQEFALSVPVTAAQLAAADRDAIRRAFDALHEQRYAHHATDERVELINLRLVALGRRPKIVLPAIKAGGEIRPRERRAVHFDVGRPFDCPVYRRDELPAGGAIAGPALVSEYGSTTVIFPGDRLSVAETGELVVAVAGEAE
ncbi:MAG TPA: hydantoinase/oxoprolinase family protein [Stellaceae bacterium]|nr:hydantoinase/oxoprolinase family protein [Stellaceae bacterium]